MDIASVHSVRNRGADIQIWKEKVQAMAEQTRDEAWFKRLEEDGLLRDEFASLGWAFWPEKQNGGFVGFFDEGSLRKLADEIERRNKPFWDSYDEHCLREYGHDEEGQSHFDFYLGEENEGSKSIRGAGDGEIDDSGEAFLDVQGGTGD